MIPVRLLGEPLDEAVAVSATWYQISTHNCEMWVKRTIVVLIKSNGCVLLDIKVDKNKIQYTSLHRKKYVIHDKLLIVTLRYGGGSGKPNKVYNSLLFRGLFLNFLSRV